MTQLKISPDLSLPEDAFYFAWGILAMRGAGKTNAAAVMAEELYDAGRPFAVVDPVGSWWGLRAGADGGPGLAIPIFGGDHADVPLEERGGRIIADFLVEERASCVIDASALSETAKHVFLGEFAEQLLRRNREPLTLFLEEADDYAPQRVMTKGPAAVTLGRMQALVKRGRFKGISPVLITQRSAAINKDLLTQIDNLVVLRTTSPQDRKAIAAWVESHGQSKELLDSLPELEDGEAWLWSPHALKVLERFRFRRRRTFDSGATPKGGKARPAATLADVDLGALQKRMAATIEKAKAEDPRELRRQIAALKKQVQAGQVSTKYQEPPTLTVEVPVFREGEVDVLAKILLRLDEVGVELNATAQEIHSAAQLIAGTMAQAGAITGELRQPRPVPISRPHVRERKRKPQSDLPTSRHVSDSVSTVVSKPQQKILDALAWFESMTNIKPRRSPLAAVAGSSSKSSGFEKNMSTLKTAGLLDYPERGRAALTDAGRQIANPPASPGTTQDLQEAIFGMVSKPQAVLLRVLIAAYPGPLTREELADRADVSVVSSGFEKNVSTLKSFELVDYPARGFVVALPVLFLEDA